MTELEEGEKFERLVQRIDPESRLLGAWELKGGVSAHVTAIEIERPNGRTQRLVVRRHGAVDLGHNPHVAADEFKLLRILRSAGLPTPEPYYLDESGEIFSTPYIVVEFMDGKAEFAPSNLADLILQMARHLSGIHKIDCSTFDLSFLPEQAEIYAEKFSERPVKVDESLAEGLIRDVLEPAWPLPQHNRSVLLHGDYWPGNILWKDGKLVGIIDWEDAQLGDPLADLANSRLEILWAFGIDAMRGFTRHYASMAKIDLANLPYWDLCAALRPAFKIAEWAADGVVEQKMREQHRLFVAHAFERLSTH